MRCRERFRFLDRDSSRCCVWLSLSLFVGAVVDDAAVGVGVVLVVFVDGGDADADNTMMMAVQLLAVLVAEFVRLFLHWMCPAYPIDLLAVDVVCKRPRHPKFLRLPLLLSSPKCRDLALISHPHSAPPG